MGMVVVLGTREVNPANVISSSSLSSIKLCNGEISLNKSLRKCPISFVLTWSGRKKRLCLSSNYTSQLSEKKTEGHKSLKINQN